MKTLIKSLALTLVYFAAAKLALRLAAFHPSAAPVWPPTGIALACLLIWGPRLWPGVFLGAFLANLMTFGNVFTSLGIATGNTLEAVVGTWLVNRYANGTRAIERPIDIFKFALVAGFIGPLFSATLGVTSLTLAGYAAWTQYAQIWLIWWVGDMTSSITIAPFLLLWASPIRRRWTSRQLPELGAFCAALLFASWAIYKYPVEYLCVPMVIWAAFRFGEREAATTSLFCTIVAIWGVLIGHGSGFPQSQTGLLVLETFTACITLTGLLLASLVSEQKKRDELARADTERALIASEKRYQQLLQANIVGTMIVDWDGRVLDANDAFLSMMGYSREELSQGKLGGPEMTPKEYHAMDEWIRAKLHETGVCPTVEKEYFRKDGSRIPVLVGVVFQEKPDRHLVCLVIDASDRRHAMDALRKAYDEMETRVAVRTRELANANKDLTLEIDRRKRAEMALQSLAITDPLTGLYNRRGFKTLADQLLRQARRSQKPVIFFLADLDGLKHINDTFGHLEGDHAVHAAATILKDTFRSSDVVARFGGDEFAIATIDDANEPEHQPYLERLREKIREFNQTSHKKYTISLSVGVARVASGDTRSIEDLIECADKELYNEKRAKKANM